MMRKLLSSVVILVVSLSGVWGQKFDCNQPLTDVQNLTLLVQYVSHCYFSTQSLKMDCISSSCPLLRGVCPVAADGQLNHTALTNAVSILNACVTRDHQICNSASSTPPGLHVSWTTDDLIPVDVAHGICNVNFSDSSVDNFASLHFSLSPGAPSSKTGQLFNLTILAPSIIDVAGHNCTFNVSSETGMGTLYMPHMLGTYHLNVSAIASIDLSPTGQAKVSMVDDRTSINITFANFVSSTGVALNSTLVDLMNQRMNTFQDVPAIYTAAPKFLATLAVRALQVAQQGCPHS